MQRYTINWNIHCYDPSCCLAMQDPPGEGSALPVHHRGVPQGGLFSAYPLPFSSPSTQLPVWSHPLRVAPGFDEALAPKEESPLSSRGLFMVARVSIHSTTTRPITAVSSRASLHPAPAGGYRKTQTNRVLLAGRGEDSFCDYSQEILVAFCFLILYPILFLMVALLPGQVEERIIGSVHLGFFLSVIPGFSAVDGQSFLPVRGIRLLALFIPFIP